MAVLLQLSLCVVTVIQLTSSQSTYDVIEHDNDVNSCGRVEQMFSEIAAAMSLLKKANTQLQKDVAELKTVIQQKDVRGMRKDILKSNNCSLCSQLSHQAKTNCMTVVSYSRLFCVYA